MLATHSFSRRTDRPVTTSRALHECITSKIVRAFKCCAEPPQAPPLTGTYLAPTANNPAASTTTANAAVNELAVAMLPISGGPSMKPL